MAEIVGTFRIGCTRCGNKAKPSMKDYKAADLATEAGFTLVQGKWVCKTCVDNGRPMK